MATLTCPNCRTNYTRRVRREGFIERLVSLGSVYPFRCQLCGFRFSVRQPGVRYRKVLEDRREYERIPIRFPITMMANPARYEGTVLDISLAGCSVEIDAELSVGTILQLSLHITGDKPPLPIDAAVVRFSGPKRTGLQFLQFQEHQREALRHFLRTLITARER